MTKTYSDYGTMTATASCELCGSVEPPKFRTFMELTPMAGNGKTVVVKVSGRVLYFRFEWFQQQPSYVKMWSSDNTNPKYIGTYDYQKNRVFTAPSGLASEHPDFIVCNIMLEKFEKGTLHYQVIND